MRKWQPKYSINRRVDGNCFSLYIFVVRILSTVTKYININIYMQCNDYKWFSYWVWHLYTINSAPYNVYRMFSSISFRCNELKCEKWTVRFIFVFQPEKVRIKLYEGGNSSNVSSSNCKYTLCWINKFTRRKWNQRKILALSERIRDFHELAMLGAWKLIYSVWIKTFWWIAF